MLTQFSRTELLLGKEAMNKLEGARVAVFGIGGVGGYVCEALVRSGVGKLDLIDNDKVCMSNLNRQIIATRNTVGKYKTEVMKSRILEINPETEVNIHNCFFLPENAEEFPFEEYDYVVDAVDTVTAKIALVMKCKEVDGREANTFRPSCQDGDDYFFSPKSACCFSTSFSLCAFRSFSRRSCSRSEADLAADCPKGESLLMGISAASLSV